MIETIKDSGTSLSHPLEHRTREYPVDSADMSVKTVIDVVLGRIGLLKHDSGNCSQRESLVQCWT